VYWEARTTQIMILQLENDNKDRNEFHEDGEKCEKGMYIFFKYDNIMFSNKSIIPNTVIPNL